MTSQKTVCVMGKLQALLTDTTTDKSTSDADLLLCSLVSVTPVCWKKMSGTTLSE